MELVDVLRFFLPCIPDLRDFPLYKATTVGDGSGFVITVPAIPFSLRKEATKCWAKTTQTDRCGQTENQVKVVMNDLNAVENNPRFVRSLFFYLPQADVPKMSVSSDFRSDDPPTKEQKMPRLNIFEQEEDKGIASKPQRHYAGLWSFRLNTDGAKRKFTEMPAEESAADVTAAFGGMKM